MLAQQVDEPRQAPPVVLLLGDHDGVRLLGRALPDRVHAPAPEVVQHLRAVAGGVLECREDAGLHVVGVVAQRPLELLRRRHHPVPVRLGDRAAGPAVALGVDRALDGLGGRVAERLVAAADPVVVDRHRVLVDLREALAEAVGPHAGQAHRGERRDLLERDRVPLAEDARVEVRVVGPGAGPDRQERHRLVQVVDHERQPAHRRVLRRARERELPLDAVAVVVVAHVLAPVGRRQRRQVVVVGLALQVAVEPLDHAVAAVRLGRRVDEHDQLVADLADVGLLRDGEPVRQLHQHLGGAGLRGVQAAVEQVGRLHRRHDLLGHRLGGLPRVGEVGHRLPVGLGLVEALLVADGHQQDLAALFRAADHLDADAPCRRRERPVVGVDLRGVRELAGRADDVPQVLGRRGNPGLVGHVGRPTA